jgi:predicted DNA-binding transcriptional regulator YafY
VHRGQQVLRQWKLLRSMEAARRGLSVAELRAVADDACSTRTLYRDLADLQGAGFPLVNEDGRWRVLETGEGAWSIPVQPTQVLALALSADLFEPIEGSWLAEPLRALRSTLAAMLTPAGRGYLAELRKTALATLFAPGDYRGHREALDAVQEAIERQHALRIRYRAPRREGEERVIEPYSTWYAAGRVYVIAYCRRAEDVRTFAAQRIERAEVLDEPFEPIADFDPAAYVRSTFGVYRGPVYRYVIDFAEEVAHLVRERRYHHTQRITDRPDGVRLTFEAAGLPEVAAWVASLGGLARAVSPRELVEAVRRLHERGLEVHGR